MFWAKLKKAHCKMQSVRSFLIIITNLFQFANKQKKYIYCENLLEISRDLEFNMKQNFKTTSNICKTVSKFYSIKKTLNTAP
jgi:hypothetical protein